MATLATQISPNPAVHIVMIPPTQGRGAYGALGAGWALELGAGASAQLVRVSDPKR